MSYKSYYSSGKPALWGGTSTEHSSIVVTPAKYRAPESPSPKFTKGERLIKKRGFSTIATPVKVRSI